LKNTEKGSLHLSDNLEKQILGMRDPVRNWSYDWRGDWHWLTFDLPRSEQRYRKRLLRFLKHEAFGCMQGSLWVTPFPPSRYADAIQNLEISEEKLFLMRGQPEYGYENMDIVSVAWDWERIQNAYRSYQTGLKEINASAKCENLADCFERESRLWRKVSALDPFLPKRCLSDDYLGWDVWEQRCRILGDWAQRAQKAHKG
jgi:DNA-binding transcriptional regulator PaaX